MSDLIGRMRERSISWERVDYEQLQDYWMEAVKDGHKAADRLEHLQDLVAVLERIVKDRDRRLTAAQAKIYGALEELKGD